MDFWTSHSIMFVIGLIVAPRVVLLYFGSIQPLQIPPILGFMFVPRMFLASLMTTAWFDTNTMLVVICWIIAIVLDVIGLIMRFAMVGMI